MILIGGNIIMLQNDIVLVPFPYSDQSENKIRPGVIISNNEFNTYDDIIVCAITSNTKKRKYSVPMTELPIPSRIRVDNLLKIDKRLVRKKIGEINKNTQSQIRKELLNLISNK